MAEGQTAELILLVVEAGTPLNSEERQIIEKYCDKVIILANKIDLLTEAQVYPSEEGGCRIPFSVLNRQGFEDLEAEIRKRVYQGRVEQSSELLISNARQISSLEKCRIALDQGLAGIGQGLPWDILSIDLREALQHISELTGQEVQESLLENIFSRFCIGK